MKLIYQKSTGKVLIYWDYQGEDWIYPEPMNDDEEMIELPGTEADFDRVCLESAGSNAKRPGEMFLHDTVEQATRSTKTKGVGKRIGHKAVEAKDPHDVPSPLADIIRSRKTDKSDNTVTLEELAEAEKELRRRAL